MLSIRIEDGKAVEAVVDFNDRVKGAHYETRNDWKTLEQAARRASELSMFTALDYIPTDSGPNVSPRFDVIQAPVLGDPVSCAFNGDYYPAGHIVEISKSLRVISTSTGTTFYRRKQSGAWIHAKTWTMVRGHRNERNPHF